MRIVITAEIERRPAERIKGQLAKLVDIFKVDMISHEEGTFRAFGMMKIACTLQTRPQILQLLEIFNGRVLELTTEWILVEMTGTPEQLEGLLHVLQPYGILEAVETGPIVIRRNSPRHAAASAAHVGSRSRALAAPQVQPPIHRRRRNAMAQIFYDNDADLSLVKPRRSPSSATDRRAMRTL